ncbi:MAG TPA: hypothetical protein DEH02_19185, partial [Bacteroidales bacterium]|nr:hypothetical protein [Bacteroidales bacterium]
NIVVTDSGYVIVGGGGFLYTNSYIQTSFFNTLGEIVLTKKFRKAGYDLYHGLENSLIKITPAGYALVGSLNKINSNEKAVLFCRFNDTFDTLWTKNYLYDTVFISGRACLQKDNHFYLTGEKRIPTDNSNILLIKTDENGNMLWYKTHGGSLQDYGTKIINTYEGNILIGGYTKNFQSAPITDLGAWYLVKADTAGTKLWQGVYGNAACNDGWLRSLLNMKDSGYAAGGHYAIENNEYKNYIIRFDKNLSAIWERLYLTISPYTTIYSMLELPNGNLNVVGIEIKTGATVLGFMMEITPQGHIIWKRNYNATGSINSINYALANAVTPDNGYAFTGYAYDNVTPQAMWLVKTDSLGCDGVHSCDDTTMFVTPLNLPDSVCFGDSVHITFGFGGRSAPYTLQSTTGFTENSIYYFDSGNDTITRIISFLPQQANTQYTFTVTLTDPWGATKTEQYSFYIKNCSTSVALHQKDLLKYQVYPNPAKDVINISYSLINNGYFELYDLLGKKIVSAPLDFLKVVKIMSLSQIKSGVYYYKITSGINVITIDKLLIVK